MTDLASPRKVTLRLYTHVKNQRLFVRVALAGETHPALGGKALLEIVRGDTGNIEGQWVGPQKALMRRTVRKLLPGASETAVFPVSKLPQGDWCVRATFIDRLGRRCHTETVQDRFLDPPEWFGSPEGVSRRVPAPWTKLEVRPAPRSVRVRCWGREHFFGTGSFLRQVTSLGRPLLRAPITLNAQVNSLPVRWRASRLKCIRSSADQAVLIHEATAGSLSLHGQMEVDFDGMIRFDWRLESSEPVRVDELTLEIPIRQEFARYFYQYRGRCGDDRWIGRIPPAGLTKGFRPYIWIGDERTGLSWFAESDENWFHADPDRCLEIRRRNGAVTVRLRLVSRPVIVTPAASMFPLTDRRPVSVRSLRYTFGLQATPVKPVVKDAWDTRTICIQQHTVGLEGRLGLDIGLLDRLRDAGVRTVVIFEHWTDVEAHKIPCAAALLKKIVRACHKRDMQVLFYFGFLLSDLAPEYRELAHSSFTLPKTGWSMLHYLPQPAQAAWRVCLRSPWQDLVASGVAYVMDELGADGVYLDGTASPYACRNMLHGCGVLRKDGSIGPTFPIFSVRSAMRRIHEAVTSRKPDGQVNVHNSTCMTTPTLAWATSTWDGEQFAGLGRGADLDGFLPLDVFRTEFMGHQWGIPAELLCYGKPLSYRQAWALALLHDVPVRPMLNKVFDDVNLASRIWKAMDEFGRNEAEWVPYWRNADFVKTSPTGVQVSLYIHQRNGILAVVSNLTAESAVANLRFGPSWPARPQSEAVARDALTQELLRMRDGVVQFRLRSLEWRLVWVAR